MCHQSDRPANQSVNTAAPQCSIQHKVICITLYYSVNFLSTNEDLAREIGWLGYFLVNSIYFSRSAKGLDFKLCTQKPSVIIFLFLWLDVFFVNRFNVIINSNYIVLQVASNDGPCGLSDNVPWFYFGGNDDGTVLYGALKSVLRVMAPYKLGWFYHYY